MRVVVPERFT
uniref:Uncharacterized protein n=1 Tax=Arundo donax TaxID=35708 RepID=A0A0A9BVH8_ARUDO